MSSVVKGVNMKAPENWLTLLVDKLPVPTIIRMNSDPRFPNLQNAFDRL